MKTFPGPVPYGALIATSGGGGGGGGREGGREGGEEEIWKVRYKKKKCKLLFSLHT